MGKPTICICKNKGADQLRGNREADQRLCFRYLDSTIPPLLKDLLLMKLKGVPLFIRLINPNGAIWSLDQRTVIMT